MWSKSDIFRYCILQHSTGFSTLSTSQVCLFNNGLYHNPFVHLKYVAMILCCCYCSNNFHILQVTYTLIPFYISTYIHLPFCFVHDGVIHGFVTNMCLDAQSPYKHLNHSIMKSMSPRSLLDISLCQNKNKHHLLTIDELLLAIYGS